MLSYNNAYELSPFKQVVYHFGYCLTLLNVVLDYTSFRFISLCKLWVVFYYPIFWGIFYRLLNFGINKVYRFRHYSMLFWSIILFQYLPLQRFVTMPTTNVDHLQIPIQVSLQTSQICYGLTPFKKVDYFTLNPTLMGIISKYSGMIFVRH